MVPWRVGGRWYAAAVALPVVTLVVAGSLNRALGAPAPHLAQFTPWYTVLLLFAVNVVDPSAAPWVRSPVGGGSPSPACSAPGHRWPPPRSWRCSSPARHLPLLSAQFGLRPVELLSTAAVTFWYAWLFNSSGGSIVPALVAHAVDASLETSTLWSGNDGTRLITLWAVVASTLTAVLIVTDWHTWTTRVPALEES